MWIIISIVVFIVLLSIILPSKCHICDVKLGKVKYSWTIDEKVVHLCPMCNTKMKRKRSNQKFKEKFG